jgi:hypothetical protein
MDISMTDQFSGAFTTLTIFFETTLIEQPQQNLTY